MKIPMLVVSLVFAVGAFFWAIEANRFVQKLWVRVDKLEACCVSK